MKNQNHTIRELLGLYPGGASVSPDGTVGKTVELVTQPPEVADLVAALQVVLDQIDYTSGACRVNEPVGGCLPKAIIEMARAALAPFAEVEQ